MCDALHLDNVDPERDQRCDSQKRLNSGTTLNKTGSMEKDVIRILGIYNSLEYS